MIIADRISVRFATPTGGYHQVLTDFSLEVAGGQFASVIGPSGCGKTTFLRCVAGLQPYESGKLLVSKIPVTGCGPERRMVFQDVALLPWRTLQSNVELGLEIEKISKRERHDRALDELRRVGLERFSSYYPHQVSGGMKQRAGLARSLVTKPQILLMDEPFGALDAQTRRMLQDDMVRIVEDTQVTILLVTHDMEEAALLSDSVFVMGLAGVGLVDTINITEQIGRDRAGRLEEIRLSAAYVSLVERIWMELRSAVLGTSRAL